MRVVRASLGLIVGILVISSLAFTGDRRQKPSGITSYVIYNDEIYDPNGKADAIANGHGLNQYLLWFGTNSDNIGTDTTRIVMDTLAPAVGKRDIHWHVADGPNPSMWFIIYHNQVSYSQPLDASSTGRVTFWVKAQPGSPNVWFWAEDASYTGTPGQTARIEVSGSRVYANNKVIVDEDWNGHWQFVSLPWSLLQSSDTAFVKNTFPLSWTTTVNAFNRSIVRQFKFDTNAWPGPHSRPPSGQGYIADFYVDDIEFVPEATGVLGVNEKNSIPVLFDLHQNYPNPFNPTTTITYDLPTYADVTLVVYNELGQKVRTLVDGVRQSPGTYAVTWDGRNDNGQSVVSGVYLYKLQASHYTATKKMLLVK